MPESLEHSTPTDAQPIRHILVVEDEPLVQDLLLDFLRIGFPTAVLHCAATLTDTKAILHRTALDVVILDLGLTDSDGIATLAAVSACNTRVPVVVVTGDPDPTLAETVILAGAADYIAKTSLSCAAFIARVQAARDKQLWSRKTLETLREVKEAFSG